MAFGGRRSLSATRASWAVPATVVVLVLVSLWYGQAPPRSVPAYEKQASDTAAFLHSQLETARLWVQERPAGVFNTSLAVGIEESEADASVTLARFAGYDPPPGTEHVRARLSHLGQEATRLLEEMRIAVHREDWAALRSLAQDAEQPSRELARLSTRVPTR